MMLSAARRYFSVCVNVHLYLVSSDVYLSVAWYSSSLFSAISLCI